MNQLKMHEELQGRCYSELKKWRKLLKTKRLGVASVMMTKEALVTYLKKA